MAGIIGTILGVITVFVYANAANTEPSYLSAITLGLGFACLFVGFYFSLEILKVRHPNNPKVEAILQNSGFKMAVLCLLPGIWLTLSTLISANLQLLSLILIPLSILPIASAAFLSWTSERNFMHMLTWTALYWLGAGVIITISAMLSVILIGFILTPIALAVAIFAHARMLERAIGLTLVKGIELSSTIEEVFE